MCCPRRLFLCQTAWFRVADAYSRLNSPYSLAILRILLMA